MGSGPQAAFAAWPHDAVTHPGLGVSGAGDQTETVTVPDGAGGAFTAWTDSRNGNNDIFLQRITAAGTISPGWPAGGLPVCAAAGTQGGTVMIADGTGGVIIAWSDQRAGLPNVDVYVQRVLGNGSLAGPGWTVDGVRITTGANEEGAPVLCTDGAGGALIAYEYRINVNDYDIYRARITSAGVLSPGPTPLYTPVDVSRNLSAVSDGAGGCIIGFESNLAGNYDVLAIRFNSSGNIWPGAGSAVVVCNAANHQSVVKTVSDGVNGAYFVWYDQRSGTNTDVYATRLDGSGARPLPWPVAGTAIEALSSNSGFNSSASDGNGGLLISWSDYRFGTTSDIFGVRILANGARPSGWPSHGQVLCVAEGMQTEPRVIGDGSGGMVVSWRDQRGGGPWFTYAVRMLAGGARAPGWDLDGNPIDLNSYGAAAPMVPDGSGGAIASFETSFFPRVAAQRIDRFGALGNAEPILTSVKDVPGDQGGQIRLQWKGSYLDSVPLYDIGEYWVWRQTPVAVAAAAVSRGASWVEDHSDEARGVVRRAAENGTARLFRRDESAVADFAWEFLAAQPANASLQYSYVTPTISDSGSTNKRTVYMIEAHDLAGNAYWQSPPDSGYSVDNLPPLTPAPFTGVYGSGSTALEWGQNFEADFASYRLHRGNSAGFVPGPGNLVTDQQVTGYADPGPAGSYYKLAAVDVHGNLSAYAVLSPSGTVDVATDLPLVIAMSAPRPNPAVGRCVIPFALPRDAQVSIEVFDVSGRRVRELVRGTRPAGEHVATWDARDDAGRAVGGGLYFVRMTAEGRSFRSRVFITR